MKSRRFALVASVLVAFGAALLVAVPEWLRVLRINRGYGFASGGDITILLVVVAGATVAAALTCASLTLRPTYRKLLAVLVAPVATAASVLLVYIYEGWGFPTGVNVCFAEEYTDAQPVAVAAAAATYVLIRSGIRLATRRKPRSQVSQPTSPPAA